MHATYIRTYVRTYIHNSQSVYHTAVCSGVSTMQTVLYFYFYLANKHMCATHSAGWFVSTYNVLLLRLCAGFEGNGRELTAKILQPLLNIGFGNKVCRCGVVYTMSGWTHITPHPHPHPHPHTDKRIYTTHTRTYFVQNEH